MYDGCLTMMQTRDGLAGITENGKDLLFGEIRFATSLHQAEDVVLAVRHQQENFVDAASCRRQARIDVAYYVLVAAQVALEKCLLEFHLSKLRDLGNINPFYGLRESGVLER